ncbi:hypothetical protein P8C59_003915 [Phyllachora maydis]|uniref:Uncharacterized protein n=1 Tax=Phyllachora maydis TaxID=1825666 RepID=A0AAD9I2C3_9PEZI|nr:hypothetical protein P8C59_003915 [Phyllachora maydis]
MYIYIACLPCRCYYYDLSFADLLIANIDSFSDLDDSVYTIPGISTAPLALALIPTKPAKIMLARSKRTAGSNTSRYTTDSGLTADKDDNDVYNRAYVPPANIEEKEEEEGSSSDDNSVNSSTSNSADKGKGSSIYERGEGSSRYKDTLLYK